MARFRISMLCLVSSAVMLSLEQDALAVAAEAPPKPSDGQAIISELKHKNAQKDAALKMKDAAIEEKDTTIKRYEAASSHVKALSPKTKKRLAQELNSRTCLSSTKGGPCLGSKRAQQLGEGVQGGEIGASSVTVKWLKLERRHCNWSNSKASTTAYATRQQAEDACACNAACHAIYDASCDGKGNWYLCKAQAGRRRRYTWPTSSSSCLYKQSVVAAPFLAFSDRMATKCPKAGCTPVAPASSDMPIPYVATHRRRTGSCTCAGICKTCKEVRLQVSHRRRRTNGRTTNTTYVANGHHTCTSCYHGTGRRRRFTQGSPGDCRRRRYPWGACSEGRMIFAPIRLKTGTGPCWPLLAGKVNIKSGVHGADRRGTVNDLGITLTKMTQAKILLKLHLWDDATRAKFAAVKGVLGAIGLCDVVKRVVCTKVGSGSSCTVKKDISCLSVCKSTSTSADYLFSDTTCDSSLCQKANVCATVAIAA